MGCLRIVDPRLVVAAIQCVGGRWRQSAARRAGSLAGWQLPRRTVIRSKDNRIRLYGCSRLAALFLALSMRNRGTIQYTNQANDNPKTRPRKPPPKR